MKAVIATSNQGKLREFKSLFNDIAIEIEPQSKFNVPDAVEDGLSFVENALIKARHASKLTNLPSIADDSGLEVDYLKGAPGIYSSRFAGNNATDEENISKLNEKDEEKLKLDIEKVVPKEKYTIQLQAMDSEASPFIITQPEFMRRMKDMQNSGGNSMFGNMPEMYNLIVNTNNKLISDILNTKTKSKKERLIKQSLDLAKLSQNLLKGEDLTKFIKRSFDLIK